MNEWMSALEMYVLWLCTIPTGIYLQFTYFPTYHICKLWPKKAIIHVKFNVKHTPAFSQQDRTYANKPQIIILIETSSSLQM